MISVSGDDRGQPRRQILCEGNGRKRSVMFGKHRKSNLSMTQSAYGIEGGQTAV